MGIVMYLYTQTYTTTGLPRIWEKSRFTV